MHPLAHVLTVSVLVLQLSSSSTPNPADEVTLGNLRDAIAEFHREGRADPTFPIDLAGYTFYWELDLGEGRHYVLISQNLQGQILVFSADNSLVHRLRTTEITGLQLCDLNADLRFELILTQVDARGTGLVLERFHVYELGQPAPHELWSGVSYSLQPYESDSGQIEYKEARGFLRCGDGGLQHYVERGDRRSSIVGVLTHLRYSPAGTLEPEVENDDSHVRH